MLWRSPQKRPVSSVPRQKIRQPPTCVIISDAKHRLKRFQLRIQSCRSTLLITITKFHCKNGRLFCYLHSLTCARPSVFISVTRKHPPSRRMDSITARTRWSIRPTRPLAASGPNLPTAAIVLYGDIVHRRIDKSSRTAGITCNTYSQRAVSRPCQRTTASGPASPIRPIPFAKAKYVGVSTMLLL